MPELAYVGCVEISAHDADTVYLAATRYKLADYAPYLFRSTDSGRTWQRISTGFPAGEITRVIRADPVQRGLAHINPKVYVPMQGPSELGMSADAKLANWDRVADLEKITVPTLVIGARYDTMDPEHMEMMAGRLRQGSYLFCPAASHLAMYDDQDTYFDGLIKFLRGL